MPLRRRTAAATATVGRRRGRHLLQPRAAHRGATSCPALIGVILTMTMVLFTAVALVRERERGNLETADRHARVAAGADGRQAAALRRHRPGADDRWCSSLGACCSTCRCAARCSSSTSRRCVFIAANLSLGILISTLAQTQFQAMQMSFFTFLPSILLSGFMFPFAGMPRGGAVDRGGAAADAFPAADARHHAARRGSHRPLAVARRARCVHRRDARGRGLARRKRLD